MLPAASVNYVAVLVSAIVVFLFGAIWYQDKLFGRKWVAAVGIEMGKGEGVGKAFAGAFIGSIITALGMAVFLGYAAAATGSLRATDGLVAALMVWFAFFLPLALNHVLFEKRSWEYFGVSEGYHLVGLILTGLIVASWTFTPGTTITFPGY